MGIALGKTAWETKQKTGKTYAEIAIELGSNKNTVRRSARSYAQSINVPPMPQSGRKSGHVTPEFQTPAPDLPDLDELLRLCRASASVINRVDPVVTHEVVTFDTSQPIGVIFVSCAHLGGRYTFYDEFERIFSQVL